MRPSSKTSVSLDLFKREAAQIDYRGPLLNTRRWSMNFKRQLPWRERSSWSAIALGVCYGLLARALFGHWTPEWARPLFGAVSIAFLFFVPMGLGALTVYDASRTRSTSWLTWIFRPWIACVLLALAFSAFAWEGGICLVIMAPVYLTMASIGGIVAGVTARDRRNRGRDGPSTPLLSVLAFPFLLAPVEQQFAAKTERRSVETEVHIQADSATVFRNIAEVPAIADAERPASLFQRIGVPRPSQATLSYQGVGAVRDARFVEGIRFRETITRFEPGKSLAFTIAVDPTSIDPRVLDEHVAVGGPFFDVEYGEFRIEPSREGGVILHLSSRHRLTTHFNFYASLWTDAIMLDLQRGICRIVQQRSER